MQLKVFHLRRSRFAPLVYYYRDIITINRWFASPVPGIRTRLIGVLLP